MADWKNAADYKFADKGRRSRWVWEFMRRNAEYRADFASVPAATIVQLEEHRKEAGFGAARALFSSARVRGWKWQIEGEIQDPASDAVPEFRLAIPEAPLLNTLDRYYEEPDGSGEAVPLRPFSVLVFHLDQDISMQLNAASNVLRYLQKARGYRLRRKNLRPLEFATYLRVLDANEVGASKKEIVAKISAYKAVEKMTDAAWGYEAQKRIRKDLLKAQALVANPWSILSEKTSPISMD